MKLIQIVIVWLVALVTGAKCDFAGEFIKFPELAELNEPYHRQIASAVEKLNLPDEVDPRGVRLELRAALARDDVDPTDREVYRMFVSLLDEDFYCPAELVRHIKSVVAQIRADPSTPLAKLKHFTVKYGRKKLKRCADRIEALTLIPGRSLEKRFDNFFMNALALDPWKVKDELLIEVLLANTSLSNMKLDSEALFKFIRKNKVTFRGYKRKRNFGNQQRKDRTITHLRNFLDVNCIKLDEYLGRTLDIINLAYVFGSRQMHQARLLKLALYHRLCLTWSKPELRTEIEANILGQAEKPKRYTQLRTRVKPKLEPISEGDEGVESAESSEE